MWSFQGKIIKRNNIDGFCNFLWRPRPPTLLTAEQQKEIKKNLKKYSPQFESKDKMRMTKASKVSNLKIPLFLFLLIWSYTQILCMFIFDSNRSIQFRLTSLKQSLLTNFIFYTVQNMLQDLWLERSFSSVGYRESLSGLYHAERPRL